MNKKNFFGYDGIRQVSSRSIFSHLGLFQTTLTPSWLIVGLLGLNFQCTWTPEVETIVYDSPQGHISLLSSEALRTPPDHPCVLSESLIKKILAGINRSHEGGMLQQLLLSNSITNPVFSPAQIDFLAPQISLALSKATQEETVQFHISARGKEDSPLSGTIAVFSPFYFLLMLNPANDFSELSSKLEKSSRNLQNTPALVLAQGEAEGVETNVETFIKFPSTSGGIVVNYQSLLPSIPTSRPSVSVEDRFIGESKVDSLINLDSLRKQLNDLQRKNEEQSEEIRRLRQTISP